ncbi:MAG: hypothetical protein WBI17_06640 [Clostridiaceae bacterium]
MMNKLPYKLLVFLMILALAGCAKSPSRPGTGYGGPETPVETSIIYTGKIARIANDSLLISGAKEKADTIELFTLPLKGLKLLDAKNKSLDPSEIEAGMLVEIEYDGVVLESYPMQFGYPKSLKVIKNEGDLIGMFSSVINDLYEVDPGLNSDIKKIALDFTELTVISNADKAALAYMVGNAYQMEAFQATLETLQEQGYIPKGELYFPDGILIKLSDTGMKMNTFNFMASKWRSGLGAYFYTDCDASFKNGTWSYTLAGDAIS